MFQSVPKLKKNLLLSYVIMMNSKLKKSFLNYVIDILEINKKDKLLKNK